MSLPRYPTYKESGTEWLGKVPEHWEVRRSRRLFALRDEPAQESDRQLTASQKYGMVYQDEFVALEGRRVVEVIKGGDILKHVEPGDFVISMRSFQGGIESCELSGSTSSAYVVLRPGRQVYRAFFSYVLKSRRYIEALQATSNLVRDGQALRFNNFVQVDLPLPPLEEQSRIAAFLDSEIANIDALLVEQQRLIVLLEEKRRTIILHAVVKGLDPNAPMKASGIAWLGDIPAHWQVGALKRHWSVTDCKHVTADFVSEGIPLASIREVQSRLVNLEGAKRTTDDYYDILVEGGRLPQAGDLIFSRNATVGEVAQVPNPAPKFAMGQDVCLLRRLKSNDSPDFLQFVLRSSLVTTQLEMLMIGSTFKRINVEEIRSLVVPIPPPAEQADIASQLLMLGEQYNELISDAERAIVLLQERRTVLISAAVTGKIDVGAFTDVEAA